MFIVEMLISVLLGIVEGITEWLPISSTGHMILVNEFLKNDNSFTSSDIYLYVIQLGAILAVATLYFQKLNPFAPSKTKEEKAETWDMWFKVVIACVPAAVIGLALDSYMEMIENWQVVSAMLIVYGAAFIVVENLQKKTTVHNMKEMDYKTALLVGAFQVLSIIPGTSRSGSTILGAKLLGCSRSVAAEFSFFLAIPVMFGVSFLKILKFVLEGQVMTIQNIGVLLVGMAVAYVVSMLAIRFLMNFVKKHDFKAFGIYRIILGIIVVLYFMIF
ncbi:MAG: undecaprenyl-diphosphate phosphatase [Clostridia bacterium]|nr:undecaprenyl-diphosphate phosphatase [Oscillospiraceae bacterium]MBQ7960035.1 undecaprenyl-diphosphate phosphatase [Clostridia bacterium]